MQNWKVLIIKRIKFYGVGIASVLVSPPNGHSEQHKQCAQQSDDYNASARFRISLIIKNYLTG